MPPAPPVLFTVQQWCNVGYFHRPMDVLGFNMRPHVKVAQLSDGEALQRGGQAPDRDIHSDDLDPTKFYFVM